MNADGSGQTRLTHTNADERWPAWSPDSTRITFSSLRDGNNSEIFIMNADGSHQVNLTNDPAAENGDTGIAWSPDGTKILYTVQAHASANPFLSQNLGLASILLQTMILMGIVLLLLRRWLPPFGSLTLLFTISSALIALLNDQYSFVLSALAAGLLADLLVWWLKPAKTRPAAFRMFALVVPIVYYSLYFLVLFLTKGIGWSIHLWIGSIVLAGITGLLLSYLLVPPLAHLKETTDN